MKKLVIGCGLVLVLFGVAATVATYYFVYRPASAFMASMSELGAVADLETALTNTSSFTPPPDGTLTAPQVQRFMTVQAAVKNHMGTRFSELRAKYDAVDGEMQDGERTVKLTEAVGAYRDLFGLITEARTAQVNALNAQNFSRDEYQWVRARVFEAAGLSVTGVDLGELVERAKEGDFQLPSGGEAMIGEPEGGVPATNKALVEPHVATLREWAPYAMFGL